MLFRLKLTPTQCIKTVLQLLLDQIHISINGSLTRKDLFASVLGMATWNRSVHSINKQYHKTPCKTSMRYHLQKMDMNHLINQNNKILMQTSLKTLKRKKKYDFAIDYTNDSYYGNIDPNNKKYVIRGQVKKSTNSFYSYISHYIIDKDKRFTISVLPVGNGKSKTDYLKYFIALVKQIVFKINVLCLDREFYSTEVFAFLQEEDIPHIVPVIKKGKRMK